MALLAAPTGAHAAAIAVDATASGAYNAAGARVGTTENFLTGQLGQTVRRSYLAFDLSGVTGTVTAAKLRLFNPEVSQFLHGYVSPQASETLAFYDVTTLAAAFLDGTAGVAGFADLGTGILFGTRSVSAADNGTVIEIDLNAAALAALNAAAGGDFLLGGALTSIAGIFDQYVFGFTMVDFVADHTRQLVLEVAPAAVPEPSALLIAGTGLLLLGLARARREGRS
ncbi:PEP-CTERM sorting domain-containing protein [Desertibaculum subflavum]|uniref:PEP-CTERM sorting domain-containing protein n=1 Tax=Desertibaculum subflavum TaxID=2268458 RepID=UPI0013C44C20